MPSATYSQADYLLGETTSYLGKNIYNELWLHPPVVSCNPVQIISKGYLVISNHI